MFLLRWATAPVRWVLKIILLLVAAIVVYLAVTLVQVWLTSREYAPAHAGAIIVMGAAQYNGVPSDDLRSRLNEALILYQQGYAHLVVCTGYKEPGDVYTEADACKMYLESKGVKATRILRAGGTDTWGNITGAAAALRRKGVATRTALIVTDPFHEDLSMAMASAVGLTPHPTPTQTSPINGWSTVPNFLKEMMAVGAGRIIGFSHIHSLLGHL